MNREGYRNLCRLVTLGYTRGLLLQAAHRQGAAARAERRPDRPVRLPARRGATRRSMTGSDDRARGVLEEYREIFGDRYYVEIQDNHLAEQEQVNGELIGAGRASSACRWSAPTTATTSQPDDARAHEVLLCIQTGKTFNDEKRWRFETDQLYVKDPEEMAAAFADVPEAIAQHPRHRRALRPGAGVRTLPLPGLPGADGRDARGAARARRARGPRGAADRAAHARRLGRRARAHLRGAPRRRARRHQARWASPATS